MLPHLTRKYEISHPFGKNSVGVFENLHLFDKPYEYRKF
jgi:hypothetical protein